MIDKNSKKWQDDQALERYRIITPLLDPEIDTKKRNALRQQISEASGYSTRTLYRCTTDKYNTKNHINHIESVYYTGSFFFKTAK